MLLKRFLLGVCNTSAIDQRFYLLFYPFVTVLISLLDDKEVKINKWFYLTLYTSLGSPGKFDTISCSPFNNVLNTVMNKIENYGFEFGTIQSSHTLYYFNY